MLYKTGVLMRKLFYLLFAVIFTCFTISVAWAFGDDYSSNEQTSVPPSSAPKSSTDAMTTQTVAAQQSSTQTTGGSLPLYSSLMGKLRAVEGDRWAQDVILSLDSQQRLLSFAGFHYWVMDYGMIREYALRPWEFGFLSYSHALNDTLGYEESTGESIYRNIFQWTNTVVKGINVVSSTLGLGIGPIPGTSAITSNVQNAWTGVLSSTKEIVGTGSLGERAGNVFSSAINGFQELFKF